MKIVKPTYYKKFKCIAGECPDSCCQGWEVDADSDSLAYYAKLDNSLDIKRKIDSVLDTDEFGNTIFSLVEKKRCPFLNGDNLCDMHIAIGGEHTPLTCRNFPRFIYNFGLTREMGLSLSCPVACDIIYNKKDYICFETETNDEPPEMNDIDPQLYFTLLQGRKKAFNIIKGSETVSEKLCSLLDLGVSLQNEINPYTEGQDTIDFFDVFKNSELINPEWEERTSHHTQRKVSDSFSNINIAEYFIYKYFLSAVYDCDILSKVKMAVVGVLINTYFDSDSCLMHLWSKETEHSQYNMDRYKNLLKTAECLSVLALKKRLSD